MLTRAASHRGTAFIEILQNCPIFNDGAFASVQDRKERPDNTLELEHGQPLLFGRERNRGIQLRNFMPENVAVEEGAEPARELLRHDETNPSLSYLLSQLHQPEFPVPIGVFRAVEQESYDAGVHRQIAEARAAARKPGNLDSLLRQGDIWEATAPKA